MSRSYIVCATFLDEHERAHDEYTVAESYTDARRAYTQYVNRDAWSATIAGVIESTDYEPLRVKGDGR